MIACLGRDDINDGIARDYLSDGKGNHDFYKSPLDNQQQHGQVWSDEDIAEKIEKELDKTLKLHEVYKIKRLLGKKLIYSPNTGTLDEDFKAAKALLCAMSNRGRRGNLYFGLISEAVKVKMPFQSPFRQLELADTAGMKNDDPIHTAPVQEVLKTCTGVIIVNGRHRCEIELKNLLTRACRKKLELLVVTLGDKVWKADQCNNHRSQRDQGGETFCCMGRMTKEADDDEFEVLKAAEADVNRLHRGGHSGGGGVREALNKIRASQDTREKVLEAIAFEVIYPRLYSNKSLTKEGLNMHAVFAFMKQCIERSTNSELAKEWSAS